MRQRLEDISGRDVRERGRGKRSDSLNLAQFPRRRHHQFVDARRLRKLPEVLLVGRGEANGEGVHAKRLACNAFATSIDNVECLAIVSKERGNPMTSTLSLPASKM